MNREEKIAALNSAEKYGFEDLVSIMELLRMPGGCPWDAEQTHESIRESLIEETYEVIEAIDNGDRALLREELGDVMLQVVFHARMEEEAGVFDINDVTDEICRKLIHRHPHVFGNVSVDNSEQVLDNWEKIKSEEKKRETVTSKLRSIPKQLPALMRAEKVGKKAKCFDFKNTDAVVLKLEEEKSELLEAINIGDPDRIEEEVGDLLLTVTSLCRKLGVKSENALNRATDKFIERFEKLENQVVKEGLDMENLSMEQKDAIWDKNKAENQ